MGTRADFYVGRGEKAEWIGSIGNDGYPHNELREAVFRCTEEKEWRDAVAKMIEQRRDGTKPEQGWPWPWETSSTTDYAYALDGGKVWASCFGTDWFDPLLPEPENQDIKTAVFPNMKDKQNVTFGERSGMMFISIPR